MTIDDTDLVLPHSSDTALLPAISFQPRIRTAMQEKPDRQRSTASMKDEVSFAHIVVTANRESADPPSPPFLSSHLVTKQATDGTATITICRRRRRLHRRLRLGAPPP